MTKVNLDIANKIIESCFNKAQEIGARPLSVVVVDEGGHTIAMQRQDGCTVLKWQIAQSKACGTVQMGFNSRELMGLAGKFPAFIDSVSTLAGGQIMPIPGGLPIKDKDGKTLGAVGISGDTGDNDELCAIAGIEALGFQTGL